MIEKKIYLDNVRVVNSFDRVIDDKILISYYGNKKLIVFNNILEIDKSPNFIFGIKIKIDTKKIPYEVIYCNYYFIYYYKIVNRIKFFIHLFLNKSN